MVTRWMGTCAHGTSKTHADITAVRNRRGWGWGYSALPPTQDVGVTLQTLDYCSEDLVYISVQVDCSIYRMFSTFLVASMRNLMLSVR